jgi:hypothetical protein
VLWFHKNNQSVGKSLKVLPGIKLERQATETGNVMNSTDFYYKRGIKSEKSKVTL